MSDAVRNAWNRIEAVPRRTLAELFAGDGDRVGMLTGRLPFGCHDWHRKLDFWRPFIEAQGYRLP